MSFFIFLNIIAITIPGIPPPEPKSQVVFVFKSIKDKGWRFRGNEIEYLKKTLDGGFSAGEGDYLPIVKVAPIYPNRALSRGIEGYCIIEFVVTRNGTTANGKVIECTSSLFANASLKAAAKFKYKARVINGTPIDVPGVQHKITFELEK